MGFDGAKQIPDISDQVQTIVEEYVDTPAVGIITTYVAVAKPTALPTDEDWSVRRVTEDTTGLATLITTVVWAKKSFGGAPAEATPRFVHVATSISTLSY